MITPELLRHNHSQLNLMVVPSQLLKEKLLAVVSALWKAHWTCMLQFLGLWRIKGVVGDVPRLYFGLKSYSRPGASEPGV